MSQPFVSPLFTDGMVLQRGQRDPIWGWTKAGQTVTVTFQGKTVSAVAGPDGKWMAHIGPFQAGGPYTLSISGSGTAFSPQRVTLHDVLLGDVWLCSGQSNMQMGVGMVQNADAEVAAADHPRIRLFEVPFASEIGPQSNLGQPAANFPAGWRVCSSASIKQGGWNGFSATAYFFGRAIHEKLNVPIGLIESAVGGTHIEMWTSDAALETMPAFKQTLADLAAARRPDAPAHLTTLRQDWIARNDPGSVPGSNGAPAWSQASLDDTSWPTLPQPGDWTNSGIPDLKGLLGVVWLRRTFEVPAAAAGQQAALDLLADDNDTTWINGVQVGEAQGYQTVRSYKVPAGLLKAGTNQISIRVLNTGGGGGLTDAGHLSLRLSGAASVPLSGAWHWRVGVDAAKAPIPTSPSEISWFPTRLYNGMIAPLSPLAIKGVLWYQGEANVGGGQYYAHILEALIPAWCRKFSGGTAAMPLPFYVVELPNFNPPQPGTGASDWAELREAQSDAVRSVSNAGLVNTIDIGQSDNLHPVNKQEVGRRLALAALAQTYGQNVQASGPVFAGFTSKQGTLHLRFSHAQGLHAEGAKVLGVKVLGFAIAGADGKYVEASAEIVGESVLISAPDVPEPKSVRYDWADNPPGNLYNEAHLPLFPFRTDKPLPPK